MMRTKRTRLERRGGLPLFALLTVLLLPLVGCDTEELLRVEDPDIILPGALNDPIGRDALFAGALAEFAVAYSGASIGGGGTEGVVMASGLLADEWVHSGTFPTRQEIDQRSIDRRNGTLLEFFRNLQRARVAAAVAGERLGEAAAEAGEADARVALLLTLEGFAIDFFGEQFCSGVPFSRANEAGELEFGEPTPLRDVFELAVARFDEAIAVAEQAGDDRILNLARVGKGRALLNLGRWAEAEEAARPVPVGFEFLIEHSINSPRQENGVFALNAVVERWTGANFEGGEGGPFLDAVGDGEGLPYLSAGDPRVQFFRAGRNVGFDRSTPLFQLLGYPVQGIELGLSAPTPLATGIEARLIVAEAALNLDRPDEALEILNELRSDVEITDLNPLDGALPELEPLPQPGTQQGLVDILFRERAFWLYATGHRLGDLRRLIRLYDRPANRVFPEGPYFKGGFYGEDTNFPIPFEEVNNLRFEECLSRDDSTF
jgi:tetratricopeptide (TPR) repeat protein